MKKTSVLIVDDQRSAQEIMTAAIERGADRYRLFQTITNASFAELCCMTGQVDLILMDVYTEFRENGIDAAAWAAFSGYQYWHDTMDGNAVQLRVYMNNPAAITTDLLVSGYVKSAQAQATATLFEKHFLNKVRTIHLDQTGAWGQTVELAARVDLTGMDVTKLMIYSYDKATNTYRRIEKPAYWVDKNGYLHFTTPYAGDIVISEGALALNNGTAK